MYAQCNENKQEKKKVLNFFNDAHDEKFDTRLKALPPGPVSLSPVLRQRVHDRSVGRRFSNGLQRFSDVTAPIVHGSGSYNVFKPSVYALHYVLGVMPLRKSRFYVTA